MIPVATVLVAMTSYHLATRDRHGNQVARVTEGH